MSKAPIADKGTICPLHKQDVSKVCHKCPWYILVRGKHPQSEEQIDQWGCAIQFLPMLLIEGAQQSRQTGAAVESFRNVFAEAGNNVLSLMTNIGPPTIGGGGGGGAPPPHDRSSEAIMVAIDFPATPALGQEFMAAGIRYAWNGYGWVVVPATGTSAEAFVLTTGDTMTGDLIIHKGNPRFTLNKNAAGELAALIGQTNGSARWQIDLGDRSLEAGGNSGSDFVIEAYNDSGLLSSTPIKINRSTGLVTILADPVVPLGVATKQYVDAKPGMVLATTPEARAGVIDTKAISPKTHLQAHTPAFHAISTGMGVSPGSWTAVTSFAEDLDTDNRFNGVSFQPNAAGWYDIGGVITLPSNGADYVACNIWFNGHATYHGTMLQVNTTQTVTLQAHGMIKFNGISDYVELVGLSDHPAGRFFNAQFYGHRVIA